MMVSVTWIETPDLAASDQESEKTGAFPILDDDDKCVVILFTGLPSNVTVSSHIEIDENTFAVSAFV